MIGELNEHGMLQLSNVMHDLSESMLNKFDGNLKSFIISLVERFTQEDLFDFLWIHDFLNFIINLSSLKICALHSTPVYWLTTIVFELIDIYYNFDIKTLAYSEQKNHLKNKANDTILKFDENHQKIIAKRIEIQNLIESILIKVSETTVGNSNVFNNWKWITELLLSKQNNLSIKKQNILMEIVSYCIRQFANDKLHLLVSVKRVQVLAEIHVRINSLQNRIQLTDYFLKQIKYLLIKYYKEDQVLFKLLQIPLYFELSRMSCNENDYENLLNVLIDINSCDINLNVLKSCSALLYYLTYSEAVIYKTVASKVYEIAKNLIKKVLKFGG